MVACVYDPPHHPATPWCDFVGSDEQIYGGERNGFCLGMIQKEAVLCSWHFFFPPLR